MGRADTSRISQVLGNLVSNALCYTSAGGSITVKVEPFVEQHSGSMHKRPAEVLVSVTDTGCGIPEVDLPHVFERFYRADKSRTRATGGLWTGPGNHQVYC